MFAQHVYARDRGPKGPGGASRAEYAAELCAELINRAQVLKVILHRAVDLDGKDPGEYLDTLEYLAHAVQLYLADVEEAEIRGRRGRLFAGVVFGIDRGVQCDAEDNETILAALGGALPLEDDREREARAMRRVATL